jgi:hypothetical protein
MVGDDKLHERIENFGTPSKANGEWLGPLQIRPFSVMMVIVVFCRLCTKMIQ